MKKRKMGKFAIGGVLASAIALALMLLSRTSGRTGGCDLKLRRVGQALTTYSLDHQGQYPKTLQSLVEHGYIPKDVLACPENSGSGQGSIQFFVPGMMAAELAQDTLVAADPAWNANQPGFVLLADGTVLHVDAGKLAESIRNVSKGRQNGGER